MSRLIYIISNRFYHNAATRGILASHERTL